jgi:ABC-2 type transport system permease protein
VAAAARRDRHPAAGALPILSGYIFPIEGMPVVFQWLATLVPANYAMQILRGLVLRGASVADLAQPIFLLFVYTVVIISIAIFRFKKTAE